MAMSMSVTWTKGTTNIANNTSTATLTVKMTTTYGSYNNNGMPATIKVTGNASYSASPTWTIGLTTTKTMFTRTFTLNHNSDGTAKVTAKVTCDTQVSSGTLTKTVSYTAPTIARASEPSVTDGTKYLGSAIAITTNRKSSSFTHTLKWEWAGKNGTIAEDVGASYSWTPATATFAPYLTDATSSSCKITCDTYNGKTKIGSKSTSFTLAIPTTVVPTISSVACSDSAGYLGTYGAYVQSKSNVRATVTATGIYGSTIASYTVAMDDASANADTNAVTIGTPYNTGSRTVTATVVDTRGRKATKTTTISVAAYSPPVISASWAKRWNTSTGQEDDESTTVRVHAQGSVTNVNSKGLNKGTVKIEYKLSTASTWTQKSSATYTTSWNFNSDIASLSSNNSYQIRVTVTDSLGSVSTQTYNIETASPVMDFLHNGQGMAIGRVSSLSNVLDVQYQIRQHQPGYFTSGGGSSGVSGYVRVCRITNTAYYQNSSIGFVISSRGHTPTVVNLKFMNRGDSNLVVSVSYCIGPINVYYVSSGNTFELWVAKSEPYDNIGLLDVMANPIHLTGYTWDFTIDFSESIPSGAVRITTWFEPQAADSNRILVSNHMALGNGIFLQGQSSSGSFSNILGMNSSNQVELNWTSGGMRGRVFKKIWEGTWSSGSITVSDLPYYNAFAFGLAGTVTTVLAAKATSDGYIRGVSVQQTSAGNVIIYCINVVANGTTLSVDSQEGKCPGFNCYVNKSAISEYTNLSVNEIYGLL